MLLNPETTFVGSEGVRDPNHLEQVSMYVHSKEITSKTDHQKAQHLLGTAQPRLIHQHRHPQDFPRQLATTCHANRCHESWQNTNEECPRMGFCQLVWMSALRNI